MDSEKVDAEAPFKSLPGFSINYFPQIGYLCAIPYPTPSGSLDPSTLEDWQFQFSTDTEEHYKNGLMRELDHHYGDLATAIDDREIELMHLLEEEVSKFTSILLTVNDDLAELDCLLSLAKVTFDRAWVRPKILEQNTIQIVAGRHPLVEGCVESYIPNDTHLVASSTSKPQRKKRKGAESYMGNPMIVLTGANFSGKSVYLKQVALIVIMAQLGSFVPAEESQIGVHDAIFTRVSTTESASRSSSAFMIDLQRISFMLRNCTARSILLIDEFGKGTDPTDGQALFCGVIEHLISRGSSCPIALVSTHFHGVFTNGFLSLDLPIDYAHMSIVLENEESEGFFTILADTTSQVANFNPAPKYDPSARGGLEKGVRLFDPIYQISSLDVLVPTNLPTSWNKLTSAARLVNYGTPVYGAYWRDAQAGSMNRSEVFSHIISLAQSKLLCSNQLPLPQNLTKYQALALLGTTIQPRLSGTLHLNSELVSSHAAHCDYISPGRDLILANYPSQFILASAANRTLADKEMLICCIKKLTATLRLGLDARGVAGELASRIILSCAMREAMRKSKEDPVEIPYGRSVRLADFLNALTGRSEDDEPEEIDQIFPIYLQSDPKARPDEKCISICAVQFTNQDPDETLFLEDEDCEWSPSLAGIELLEPNPYLVLGFSLQRSRQKSHTSGSKRCSTENDDRRASLTFNSIGSFPFLTPRLVAALEELSEAYVDLLALHREAGTKEYLLNVSPRVYAR
ncbi:hypothetical protein PtA15_4A110 [Puccinia triticina]|uniref:DNA mismatch repair proteins mutS family domain-containing protein n=1 Tax=Puccinia triticina TaxID=208348 RepID=A0ABY7CGS7_9BASI|nr:uncharacterized protein PtA15_4A110 [Puccinia triticina]WAQ83662.1 hypothetical protein PtA15_4A110 [Puccinia triticina]